MAISGEHASFVEHTTEIVLPVKVRGALVFRNVEVEVETVVCAVSLTKEFVRYNKIPAGQCMVSKSAIPGAESRDGIVEAAGSVARELLIVHVAFQNSTVLEDNSRANDEGIGVVGMDGSIDPKILRHVLDTKYFVRVLVVLETILHLQWESSVVENVRGRSSSQKRSWDGSWDGRWYRRGWCGDNQDGRSWDWKGVGVDFIEIEPIKVVGEV
jgi:hypothetical protein